MFIELASTGVCLAGSAACVTPQGCAPGGFDAAIWCLKQCWCEQCWFNGWCAGLGESQNYRMVEVGRDLWRSSCPGPLLRQGHPEPVAQDHVQASLLVSLAVVATARKVTRLS